MGAGNQTVAVLALQQLGDHLLLLKCSWGWGEGLGWGCLAAAHNHFYITDSAGLLPLSSMEVSKEGEAVLDIELLVSGRH